MKIKLYLGQIMSNAIAETDINPDDSIDVTVVTPDGNVIGGVLLIQTIIDSVELPELPELPELLK